MSTVTLCFPIRTAMCFPCADFGQSWGLVLWLGYSLRVLCSPKDKLTVRVAGSVACRQAHYAICRSPGGIHLTKASGLLCPLLRSLVRAEQQPLRGAHYSSGCKLFKISIIQLFPFLSRLVGQVISILIRWRMQLKIRLKNSIRCIATMLGQFPALCTAVYLVWNFWVMREFLLCVDCAYPELDNCTLWSIYRGI